MHALRRASRRAFAIALMAFSSLVGATAMTMHIDAAAAAPSGQSMPTTSPAGWKTTFTDDFNSSVALGAWNATTAPKWRSYSGPDSTGHGTYSAPKTVSQTGGLLNINIHTEAGKHLVAGLVPQMGTQTYGRYAIRWRSDVIPGYKQVWLLWPNSGKRPEGEIDFSERNLTDYPWTMGFLHRRNAVSSQGWAKVPYAISAWHTTVIEWKPGLLMFYMDGVKQYSTALGVPNTPFHLVLQNETQMSGGAPMPLSIAKGNVQIDWVQVSALAS